MYRKTLSGVLLCSSIVLFVLCSVNKLANSSDETEIEIASVYGKILDGSGEPLSGALVKVFRATASQPQAAIDSTYTDACGKYRFKRMKRDTYNISASYVTGTDTVYFSASNIIYAASPVNVGPGTVSEPGAVSGRVLVEENASAKGILCCIAGSPFATATDDSGRYTLISVPAGIHTLAFFHSKYRDTTVANIAVTSKAVTQAPEVKLTLAPINKERTVTGFFQKHYETIGKIKISVQGDGIPLNAPWEYSLTWNAATHFYGGIIVVPDTGKNEKAIISVYDTTGKKCGLCVFSIAMNASGIQAPVFDPYNAKPKIIFIKIIFINPSKDTALADSVSEIDLSATAVDSFGGVIKRFKWDFDGDGLWDSIMVQNKNVRHLFTEGIHSVIFGIEDDDANFVQDTVRLEVNTVNTVMQVSVGSRHTLMLDAKNTVWACGNDSLGQLGDGVGPGIQKKPVKVIDNVAAIQAGWNYSLFIKKDGTLWGCGSNIYGQLGNGMTGKDAIEHTPIHIGNNIIQAAGGRSYTMFIGAGNILYACGDNTNKELGVSSDGWPIVSPVEVLHEVTAVYLGYRHTVAIRSDKSLWAWGNNEMGQIGNGKSGTGVIDSIPVKIMSDVACASAGYKFSLAVKTDGSLWAWGENNSGQLGTGTRGSTSHVDLPVKVMDNVSFVEAGDDYTMIIKTDNTLWACGNNKNGQFGNGTQQGSTLPVYITDNVRSVSAGACHTVIIKTNGRLYSCGDNTSSQLGDATSLSKNNFVPVILDAFK